MKYRVSLSNNAKLITKLVYALLVLVICLYCLLSFVFFPGDMDLVALFVIIFAVLICVCVPFALWPRCIIVYDDRLVLKKGLGHLTIAFSEIQSIERRDGFDKSFRVFGVGGVLGNLGWFSKKNVGRYMSYVGDYRKTFLLVTEKRRYVMSCDSPDELVADVKGRLRQPV